MYCYAEAERLLKKCGKERSVTTVQAISLMSTWNASRGDYASARFYAGQSMRMALEEGLHRESGAYEMSEDIRQVHNTAFWGAFMLDQ
jgi:ATP/maltotriose-dependent transcriptional regulator MalT